MPPHPREWLNIKAAAWSAALRVELAAAGVTIDASDPAPGPESELMTLFKLMGPDDQGKLIAIAHILSK